MSMIPCLECQEFDCGGRVYCKCNCHNRPKPKFTPTPGDTVTVPSLARGFVQKGRVDAFIKGMKKTSSVSGTSNAVTGQDTGRAKWRE